jgi:hypothetical protein
MSKRALLLAVAGPPLVLTLARLVMLAAALVGGHPFWQFRPMNLSEAAAVRDGGEIVRLIAAGHDPNKAYPVRPGYLSSDTVTVTPVEAAMAVRRGEIVSLLIDEGATPPPVIVEFD